MILSLFTDYGRIRYGGWQCFGKVGDWAVGLRPRPNTSDTRCPPGWKNTGGRRAVCYEAKLQTFLKNTPDTSASVTGGRRACKDWQRFARVEPQSSAKKKRQARGIRTCLSAASTTYSLVPIGSKGHPHFCFC